MAFDLKRIILPTKMKNQDNEVLPTRVGNFSGLSSLTSVEIPFTYNTISGESFSGCTNLELVKMGDSITSIEDGESTTEDDVTTIKGAFSGCTTLKNISLSQNLTYIPNYAFCDAGLTSIIIPDKVTTIGTSAFQDCAGLKTVIFGKELNSIGANAFNGVGVTAYDFSQVSSVVSIASNSLPNPSDLDPDTKILVPAELYVDWISNANWVSYESWIYPYHFTGLQLVVATTSANETVSIRSGNLVNFSTINWGEEGGGYETASNSHEYSSAGTYTIIIPGVKNITGAVMQDSSKSKLTQVIIGEGVSGLGTGAFYNCDKLLKCKFIGNDVNMIGNSAFRDCGGLTSIIIPDSVTSIEDNAFYMFDTTTHLASVTLGSRIISIGLLAFGYCSKLTSIIIPDSVITIGANAFVDCTNLQNVHLGDNLQKINNNTFKGCSSLTSIIIPNSVKSIGEAAFYGCSSLESVNISNSVTSIEAWTFYNCTSLKSITIPFIGATLNGTDNTHFGYIFGANSFSYNPSYVPTSLKTVVITGGNIIGQYAFYGCNKLENITIPESVTSIGIAAFYNCIDLTSAIFTDIYHSWIIGSITISVDNPNTNATNLTTTYVNSVWTKQL